MVQSDLLNSSWAVNQKNNFVVFTKRFAIGNQELQELFFTISSRNDDKNFSKTLENPIFVPHFTKYETQLWLQGTHTDISKTHP